MLFSGTESYIFEYVWVHSLGSNRIMECKGMTEIQGKNLREIVIEKDNVNRMQCHDPRWFMKI